VIPAYNAAASLEELTGRIRRTSPNAQVLIVDDGSTDATGELLPTLGVSFIQHERNRGKGEALKTGFTEALKGPADAVVQMDADLQHEPESLPQFFEKFEQGGADMIIGTRDFRSGAMPRPRRMSNRLTSWAISRLTHTSVPDSQSGYRLIARRVLETVQAKSSGFDFESEFLLATIKAGFAIGTVPIATVYQGEPSAIRPWRDTARFVKLIGLFWRDWSRNRVV
jgi:glycosyltransferase involved in cell wall biosynthesis